jgi:hypothetical protein
VAELGYYETPVIIRDFGALNIGHPSSEVRSCVKCVLHQLTRKRRDQPHAEPLCALQGAHPAFSFWRRGLYVRYKMKYYFALKEFVAKEAMWINNIKNYEI